MKDVRFDRLVATTDEGCLFIGANGGAVSEEVWVSIASHEEIHDTLLRLFGTRTLWGYVAGRLTSLCLDWLGHTVVLASRGLRRISVGSINPYALVFAAGLASLLAFAYLVFR